MYLAQFNVSIEKYPLTDSRMEDFINNLDKVNSTADNFDGFVWRLQDDSGNATAMRVYDDSRVIFNLSVWKSIECLRNFVYKSVHIEVFKNRHNWFHKPENVNYVLWWIPKNYIPTIDEAKGKLEYLRKNGESPEAFTFRYSYKNKLQETK